jgi:hypothetical protein
MLKIFVKAIFSDNGKAQSEIDAFFEMGKKNGCFLLCHERNDTNRRFKISVIYTGKKHAGRIKESV